MRNLVMKYFLMWTIACLIVALRVQESPVANIIVRSSYD